MIARFHRVLSWTLSAVLAASVLSLGAAPAEAARKGTLRISVVTPAGVAATVVAVKGKSRVAVAKSVNGKRKNRRAKVAKGTWRITARPIQAKGRLYVPTVSRPRAKVRPGRTTKVTVRYKLARTASHLNVSSMSTTAIGVSFRKPRASSRVRISYAVGANAPAKPSAGRAVPVGAKAKSARITKLRSGTTYSISMFTRIGKKWVGPVTVTAGTSSTGSSAQFIAAPNTVLVRPATKVAARPVPGGVFATLAPTVSPVVGQPVVLPISATLPSGFVGTVAAVGSDGRTVTLVQAGLTDAFHYFDIRVPDITARGRVVRTPATTRSAMSARAVSSSCDLAGKKGITMDPPKFTDRGHFNVKTQTSSFLHVPKGVTIDARVAITGTMRWGADLERSLDCSVRLPGFTRSFMAGYIPMTISFTSEGKFSAKGAVKVDGIGVEATAGFQGKAYLPLPGGGRFSSSSRLIREVDWLKPSVSAAGTMSVSIGGSLSIGPGGGVAGSGGVTSGLAGSLDVLDAKAKIAAGTNAPWCVELEAGGSVGVEVFAKAWVGRYEAKASHEFIDERWTYGTYKAPGDCAPRPTDPEPSEPEPTEPVPTEPQPTDPVPTDPVTPTETISTSYTCAIQAGGLSLGMQSVLVDLGFTLPGAVQAGVRVPASPATLTITFPELLRQSTALLLQGVSATGTVSGIGVRARSADTTVMSETADWDVAHHEIPRVANSPWVAPAEGVLPSFDVPDDATGAIQVELVPDFTMDAVIEKFDSSTVTQSADCTRTQAPLLKTIPVIAG